MLRSLTAPNPSAMTLDGTRTWLVGEREVAIIDPGPAAPGHQTAIEAAVGGAAATILLTHVHPDHSAGAGPLAVQLGARVRCLADGTLSDGEAVATDAGDLIVLATPGHTPDHAAFHWPFSRAAFVGDLMMGGQDTALVAPPEGDLAAYIHSLGRLQALGLDVIHPSHGPSFEDPLAAIERYLAHRRDRCAQVHAALGAGPLPVEAVAEAVYGGTIPDELREVAVSAALAYLTYLEGQNRVTSAGGLWSVNPG